MSDYEYSDESSDEIAKELSVEQDRAINIALAKVTTGEAINNEDISIDSEYKESHNKEEKSKLLNENKEALKTIVSADPKDETDAFLLEYFSSRKWEEKQKNPSTEELKADDDLEEIDDALEFEERYNFRHQEENFFEIQRNPRHIDGLERNKETKRHKKRQEAHEKEKEQDELYNKQLDEIDEKYKKIAEENDGRLSPEQLRQYTNECADVLLQMQGGDPFQYKEEKKEGGFKKSVLILEGEEEESYDEPNNDNDNNDDNENDNDNDGERKSSNLNENKKKKWNKGSGFNKKNRFIKGKQGRFDKNRKHDKFKGVSASRLSAFESHKH